MSPKLARTVSAATRVALALGWPSKRLTTMSSMFLKFARNAALRIDAADVLVRADGLDAIVDEREPVALGEQPGIGIHHRADAHACHPRPSDELRSHCRKTGAASGVSGLRR